MIDSMLLFVCVGITGWVVLKVTQDINRFK